MWRTKSSTSRGINSKTPFLGGPGNLSPVQSMIDAIMFQFKLLDIIHKMINQDPQRWFQSGTIKNVLWELFYSKVLKFFL